MYRILVNGLNAKAAGGKSILTNFIKCASKDNDIKFYFVCPDYSYKEFSINNKVIFIPKQINRSAFQPLFFLFYLPYLARKLDVDAVLNFSDIPISTGKPQVFYFDWSYAIYPKNKAWDLMSLSDKWFRKIKLFFFKKGLANVNIIVAQTETVKRRIISDLGFGKIRVLPNAVSLENYKSNSNKIFEFKKSIKLLYLTHYYPHKNLEILIPLAELIKKKKLDYEIIITIDAKQHHSAEALLIKIVEKNLESVISNIGSVSMEEVPNLYKSCDGLLMPTYLESFSGTYIEAMYHGLPILTSNYDFSRDVCKDAAVYFDNENPNDMLKKISFVFNNEKEKQKIIRNGTKRLLEMPSWENNYLELKKILDECIKM